MGSNIEMVEKQTILIPSKKHSQKWHLYNLAKTQEKRLFYRLLYELCQTIPEPKYEFGRPRIPIRDLIFGLGLKLYSNYTGRKISSDLVHAKEAGYLRKEFHFNRLTEFLNTEGVYDLFRKLLTLSAMPLRSLEDQGSMDASGFGEYSYERWMRVRFGDNTKRGWRNYLKGHILIGCRTNIIVSCECTYGNFHDIKSAPMLLQQAQKHFNFKEISADKAYSSKRILQIIENMNAQPYIPFQTRIKRPGKDAPETIWYKSLRYFHDNREDFLEHYHVRSNVETVFSMVKMRLGEFLKCKNYEGQRNELLMKFICHNICCLIQEIFENEIHVDFQKCLKSFLKNNETFRAE